MKHLTPKLFLLFTVAAGLVAAIANLERKVDAVSSPSTVSAASIQRWKVNNGHYVLNFFGDGTLLAANAAATAVPGGSPGDAGVMGAKMDPATGATNETLVVPDVRSSIRLSTGAPEQDWIVGGYANRFAQDQDGNYLRLLRDLGCCNIPRFPLALDPQRDAAYSLSSGQLFGINMSTGNTDYFFFGAGDNFASLSIADTDTLYSSGRSGNVSKLHPSTNGALWIRNISTGDLQPSAIAADGSVVVTSGSPHFAGSVSPGMLARILPDGTVAFNNMVNAVTPPVIGSNGLIYIGTQPAPVNDSNPGAIEAYDADGTLVWTTPVDGLPNDLLIGDDGAVYAGTGGYNSGRVYVIDQADGDVQKIITEVESAWEIVLRAGLLYASGTNALGTQTSITALPVEANNYDVNSPWPVRYHDNQRTSNRTHPILTPPRIPAPATPCLGTPTFTQMQSVPTEGRYQQGVATGDFNEDGNLDLVFSNDETTLVSVRLGDGAGGFTGITNLANLGRPWGIAVGDYNADQHQDLAVMSNDSGIVRIWLGNGSGNFSGPSAYNTGSQWPISFDPVDVNLDGKLDLLSVNSSTNNITIAYGNGDGTFAAAVLVPAGSGTASAAAADLNDDGIVDLASANLSANSVSIRMGGPGGTFVPAADVPVGNGPAMVRAADFNSDGDVDLMVTNRNANTMSILLGDGTGAFTLLQDVPTPTQPGFAVLADLNNDGKTDVVVAPNFSNSLGVFIGDGAGGFTLIPGVFSDINTSKVAVGDFNNDGFADLASSNASGFANRIIIHLGGCSVPPDTEAPATTALASPPANLAGWNNTDVVVDLAAEDNPGGSGVASITYSASGAGAFGPITVNADNSNFTVAAEGETIVTFFAEDVAGNVEAVQTITIKIDKTAPEIAASAAAGGNPYAAGTWTNQDVTVEFVCTDGGSGVDSATGPTHFDSEGDGQSAAGNCVDAAGNSAGIVFGPIRIDTTAPDVSIIAPAGVDYFINDVVLANYFCSDALAGILSCLGTSANGAPIDTATVGSKTLNVIATDNAGNTSNSSVTYNVKYRVPLTKDDCKNGGWKFLTRADGTTFKNQGDCIQYVNTGL